MNIHKWLDRNTKTLKGKTVAISGSTGGIGAPLCRYLSHLGANLILLDRNPQKADDLKKNILKDYPDTEINYIKLDLEDFELVKAVTEMLKEKSPDIIIFNAGAYSIPRHKCATGFDNVFQINFVSPYFMAREILPIIEQKGGKIVAVGSIAHNYSVTDMNDIDFSSRKKASLVYGNAKRFLMFSLPQLSDGKNTVTIAHPGITFTNITAHYPKLIFAVIKHPMKIIFMKPKIAALCILKGIFEDCENDEWIGPRIFNVWGLPLKQKLKSCKMDEKDRIVLKAEEIYNYLKR